MNRFRKWAVPCLAFAALIFLFFKLPEIPSPFSVFPCKTCSSDPFFPLGGAGYFSALIAAALLFPSFPSKRMAKGGLVWALLLALVLTYLHGANMCWACMAAHGCNILIWSIWSLTKRPVQEKESSSGERLALLIFSPISTVAFFSCLNLTFMAYGFNQPQGPEGGSLRSGEPIPVFSVKTSEGRPIERNEKLILDFVSPNCPYSEEQLKILGQIPKSVRWVCVSPAITSQIVQNGQGAEWIEDKAYDLHKLFKVKGYPTLFVLGSDGRIDAVFTGLQNQFEKDLSSFLE